MEKSDIHKLIDTKEPAWPLVESWIAQAQNPVEILPTNRFQGEQTLLRLQITTRSPMGAIALQTGGIFVYHGWLRFLGAGNHKMKGNLLTWNGIGNDAIKTPLEKAFVIGFDVIGGFFAINGGAFPGKLGNVFYLAPDTLEWEDLDKSYSDTFYWALMGDLDKFYGTMMWQGWESDISNIVGDLGILVYPPFWSSALTTTPKSRKTVPMVELWNLYLSNKQSGPSRI